MAGRILTAMRGYLNRSTPGYLIFFVTPFCPCRCKMCFNMDAILNAGKRDVLTYSEIERIARNFPGLHQINFSGGDPLVRKDFPEIVKLFYDHSGTRFFTVPTSSAFPDRYADAIRKCLVYCPDAWIRVTQSIDGVGSLHDEIRQRKGLFSSVIDLNQRLEQLAAEFHNLSVGIATVYCKYNETQSYDLLDYAYQKLEFADMSALYVRGKAPEEEAKDIQAEGYVSYQKECIRRRLSRPGVKRGLATRAFSAVNLTVNQYVMRAATTGNYIMPCHAGRRMIVMDDEGRVEPCEVLSYMIEEGVTSISSSRLGNIRDFGYDIRKLLATPHARDVARQIVDKKCHCTFECAMALNSIYNFRAWPRVVYNFVRLKG